MVKSAFITNKIKLIPPNQDKNYWTAEDAPFQGFGLTKGQAIDNLEQKIKEHFKSVQPLAR